MTTSPIVVQPLTPLIGAEIHEVDLSKSLDDATFNAIHQALLAHGVIFFRDQELNLHQLAQLGTHFGAPHIHPTIKCLEGYPGVTRIHVDADSKIYDGRKWHSDVTCDPEPPMASILHLHEVPATGGDTLFSCMYAAYRALSPAMQTWLSGLKAMHESEHNLGAYFGAKASGSRDGKFPEAAHPVVRTHPETGKKALFVNAAFTTRILGLTPDESHALLGFLYQHIAAPRFQCRFSWRKNSIAFWDNRCAQHMALWDYYPHTRSGHRATIAGDRPY